MTSALSVKLRPLEREDLRFVHQLDNNASVMRYWFEEPYEAFVELSDLYDKHIHDQSERRFVVECDGEKAGLVELVEINHVHRRAEFQIIISPDYQGKVGFWSFFITGAALGAFIMIWNLTTYL